MDPNNTIPSSPLPHDGSAATPPPPMAPASFTPPPTSPLDSSSHVFTSAPPDNSSSSPKKFNGKILAGLVALVMLVGGLGVGLYLSSNQVVFQQKAAPTCTPSGMCLPDVSGVCCAGSTKTREPACLDETGYDYICDLLPTPTIDPKTPKTCDQAGGTCYSNKWVCDGGSTLSNECPIPSEQICYTGICAPPVTPTNDPKDPKTCEQAGGICYPSNYICSGGSGLSNACSDSTQKCYLGGSCTPPSNSTPIPTGIGGNICPGQGALNQPCRAPQSCNNLPNCNDGLICTSGTCQVPAGGQCGTGNCLVCSCPVCMGYGGGLDECRPNTPGAVCSTVSCTNASIPQGQCGQVDFLDGAGSYCGVKQQACTGSCDGPDANPTNPPPAPTNPPSCSVGTFNQTCTPQADGTFNVNLSWSRNTSASSYNLRMNHEPANHKQCYNAAYTACEGTGNGSGVKICANGSQPLANGTCSDGSTAGCSVNWFCNATDATPDCPFPAGSYGATQLSCTGDDRFVIVQNPASGTVSTVVTGIKPNVVYDWSIQPLIGGTSCTQTVVGTFTCAAQSTPTPTPVPGTAQCVQVQIAGSQTVGGTVTMTGYGSTNILGDSIDKIEFTLKLNGTEVSLPCSGGTKVGNKCEKPTEPKSPTANYNAFTTFTIAQPGTYTVTIRAHSVQSGWRD